MREMPSADLREGYLAQQEILQKNPMNSVPMIKKSNFMAAQNKEDLPTQEIKIRCVRPFPSRKGCSILVT